MAQQRFATHRTGHIAPLPITVVVFRCSKIYQGLNCDKNFKNQPFFMGTTWCQENSSKVHINLNTHHVSKIHINLMQIMRPAAHTHSFQNMQKIVFGKVRGKHEKTLWIISKLYTQSKLDGIEINCFENMQKNMFGKRRFL